MVMQHLNMKTKLMYSAKKLFASQGFDKISVREICEEAGANIALVSYYFGGKEKLFNELFHTFVPLSEIKELIEKEDISPVDWIKELIYTNEKFRISDPEMAIIIDRETDMNTERTKFVVEEVFPLWRKLREVLVEGQQQGVFKFESADQTMMYVISCLVSVRFSLYKDLLDQDEYPLDVMVKHKESFIFNGLGVKYTA
ncbi:TetR/AcrR family transcriptional regulator [Longirhabdus pacifica]|uniref:TetR/AcrR family transcriptional regulator n=1 Tax=Longirhabdus pacifica TaxID=2305227 RepID=UPI0013E8E8CB|nr:TetR family transcriptional regulator [Longirhabdus pacifica]